MSSSARGQRENNMEEMQISLTDKDSHTLKRKPGQGSFSFGPKHLKSQYKFDALVDEGESINWDCFKGLYTSHGSDNKDIWPNGNWPRWFNYIGNDTGFGFWSTKRKIEYFTWHPLKNTTSDFTKSHIKQFTIILSDHLIKLKIGAHTNRLILQGNIENIKLDDTNGLMEVLFNPITSKDVNDHYVLPNFPVMEQVSNLNVTVTPLGQALDCKSLLQFKNLKHLRLSGNITNLAVLKEFQNLESLMLLYVPTLKGLPPLNSWNNLNHVIVSNIEEVSGKILRKELKQLLQERDMGSSSVTKLRKPIWFIENYGIPFSDWNKSKAKEAVKAYKYAFKELKTVVDEKTVRALIIAFTEIFNGLPDIDTVERDDIALAVEQLIRVPNIEIDFEKAMQWFDDHRDY